MNIFAIIGVAIIAAILAVIVRQYKPEIAVAISLGAGVIILLMVFGSVSPVIQSLGGLFSSAGLAGEFGGAVMKALGICLICQIACDTCKDAGESSLASKIEIVGKFAVLIVAMPLFRSLLDTATGLIRS